MIRAVSFDYWDTLYEGASLPERVALRQGAVARLLAELGHTIPAAELTALYRASGAEAERWWREEQRGYTTAARIHWLLAQLGIERPADCEHVTRTCQAVDDALLAHPPALLPGAAHAVHALGAHHSLAIISDTGFASGRAQDRLLERDDLLAHFPVRIYSMDVGHAKPRGEPFAAAAAALGVRPEEVVHIGDNERTDVEGAIAAGMRAIRLDSARRGGPSAAELVARSYEEVEEYLLLG